MITQQMELSLEGQRVCRSMRRPQRRTNRAHWWFERMREVVDRAFDRQPAPATRPEQIWFPE